MLRSLSRIILKSGAMMYVLLFIAATAFTVAAHRATTIAHDPPPMVHTRNIYSCYIELFSKCVFPYNWIRYPNEENELLIRRYEVQLQHRMAWYTFGVLIVSSIASLLSIITIILLKESVGATRRMAKDARDASRWQASAYVSFIAASACIIDRDRRLAGVTLLIKNTGASPAERLQTDATLAFFNSSGDLIWKSAAGYTGRSPRSLDLEPSAEQQNTLFTASQLPIEYWDELVEGRLTCELELVLAYDTLGESRRREICLRGEAKWLHKEDSFPLRWIGGTEMSDDHRQPPSGRRAFQRP